MSTSAPLSFDLPPAHVALIRHDLAATLRRHGRVVAAALVATAATRAEWDLLGEECQSLGSRRGIGRATMERACELMAEGRTVDAQEVLAAECDLSVEAWADETRREMARGTR